MPYVPELVDACVYASFVVLFLFSVAWGLAGLAK